MTFWKLFLICTFKESNLAEKGRNCWKSWTQQSSWSSFLSKSALDGRTMIRKLLDQHFNVSLFSNPEDQFLKSKKKYVTKLSPTFNKNQHLVYWIGEQWCIEMLVRQFSNNPDICGIYVGKLSKNRFNVLLFSNPRENIKLLFKIDWSKDLRAQYRKCII